MTATVLQHKVQLPHDRPGGSASGGAPARGAASAGEEVASLAGVAFRLRYREARRGGAHAGVWMDFGADDGDSREVLPKVTTCDRFSHYFTCDLSPDRAGCGVGASPPGRA